MRASYEFARVHFTRFRPARRRAGGVRFTRLRRKARHHLFSAISLPKALLPPDSIVLLQLRRKRWHLKNIRRFANSAVGWLRFCIRLLRNSKTFPRGDGLGRHYVDDTTITTALRWLQQFPIFHRHCEPVTDVTGVAIRIPLWYALRWSHNV